MLSLLQCDTARIVENPRYIVVEVSKHFEATTQLTLPVPGTTYVCPSLAYLPTVTALPVIHDSRASARTTEALYILLNIRPS